MGRLGNTIVLLTGSIVLIVLMKGVLDADDGPVLTGLLILVGLVLLDAIYDTWK